MIEDLSLSADLNKELMNVGPGIEVCVDNKIAYIETEAPIAAEEQLVKEIEAVVDTFKGIADVRITCHPVVALSE